MTECIQGKPGLFRKTLAGHGGAHWRQSLEDYRRVQGQSTKSFGSVRAT